MNTAQDPNPADGALLADVPPTTPRASPTKAAARARGAARVAAAPLGRSARSRSRAFALARREPSSRRSRATLTPEVGKPIAQSRNELNGLLARIDFFLAEVEARDAATRPCSTKAA